MFDTLRYVKGRPDYQQKLSAVSHVTVVILNHCKSLFQYYSYIQITLTTDQTWCMCDFATPSFTVSQLAEVSCGLTNGLTKVVDYFVFCDRGVLLQMKV